MSVEYIIVIGQSHSENFILKHIYISKLVTCNYDKKFLKIKRQINEWMKKLNNTYSFRDRERKGNLTLRCYRKETNWHVVSSWWMNESEWRTEREENGEEKWTRASREKE